MIRRLAKRGFRLGTHHVRGHKILDLAMFAHISTGSAAKIAFGEDSDEPPAFHDHEMANSAAAQPSPGFARCFLGVQSLQP
jgi:hypothetical protein